MTSVSRPLPTTAYFGFQAPPRSLTLALRSSSVTPNGERPVVLDLGRGDLTRENLTFQDLPVIPAPFPFGPLALARLLADRENYASFAPSSVWVFVPRAPFDVAAARLGAGRLTTLPLSVGMASADLTVESLAACLAHDLQASGEARRPFVDEIVLALSAHLVRAYAELQPIDHVPSAGLSPWQLRLARESLERRFTQPISLASIADACGLSASQFARAFKHSTGASPHQWAMRRRIEAAKAAMRASNLPLTEIALICGFCDQAHFSRVFAASAGLAPSVWRRLQLVRSGSDGPVTPRSRGPGAGPVAGPPQARGRRTPRA